MVSEINFGVLVRNCGEAGEFIVEAIERETLKFKYGYKLAHLKIKMLKKPPWY